MVINMILILILNNEIQLVRHYTVKQIFTKLMVSVGEIDISPGENYSYTVRLKVMWNPT